MYLEADHRLTWGIPLPFDDNFVTYVWFDALINYLTGIGYPDGEEFQQYWDVAEHLIAKDILKPHAIYWPTMLMAMGVAPFAKLHVHGYWNVDDSKMSKSIGNVVRPAELIEEYGRDALRYFILREMSFGLDASFNHDAIVARKNSDLANDLGNLFSRSITMLHKYCDGVVPAPTDRVEEADIQLRKTAQLMFEDYREHMGRFAFHRGLQAVWELVSQANKYIVITEPWALVKDEAQGDRLATVLYNLVESLRMITLAVSPVMPETAASMAATLGLADRAELVLSLETGVAWGGYPAGLSVGEAKPLFPRVDVKKNSKKEASPVKQKNTQASVAEEGVITFEQFKKVELKVAEITTAERVKKSDRLLLLTVEAPEKRTIVAGIAEYYDPRDLPGMQVLLVANMKPTKIMGIRSEGMLLAARTGDKENERLVLTTVSAPVENGSAVA